LTVRRSDPEDVPEEALPKVVPVSWISSDGARVHGLFFSPVGENPHGELPPLLVNIHGGPTSQRLASWAADTAFFTTRGWAVLEVNHRGSTGYGRGYQRAMDGLWGEIDVQDVAEGTLAMAEQGLCDPARMAVKGGSAGGFTVLRLLTTRPGLFKAGVSLYGVGDLLSLVEDTHKFEARYLDRLVAPLPEGTEVYRERSPLRQVDRIRDALALFQGSEDRVVPPAQSESIAKALSERKVPYLFRLYPGEGHGWRKSETIQDYYTEVDRFLRTHVVQS
jgi:dipeptidyl aminopeptidase/acylaminoacyl peptidase